MRLATPAAVLATALATMLAAPPPGLCTGILKGKAVYRDAPATGVVVSAFTDHAAGFSGTPSRLAVTGADGTFALELPAGRYFLVANRPEAKEAPRLFAYYGGNPVTVTEKTAMEIGINCGAVMPVAEKSLPGGTGIRGKVWADGNPLSGARVTLYQDGESIYRGMGQASAMTSARGEFAFNLEPGIYFVVARKRSGAGTFGPMAVGDFFAYAPDNPLEVVADRYTVVSLTAVAKGAKGGEGEEEMTISGTVKGGETVIEGQVRDAGGKPVAGLWVAAYRDSMMISRPDFVARSKADGTFAISLPGGGDYYVGARDTLGGPAEKGSLMGRYAGNEEHLVTIKPGEKLTGVEIVVEMVK